MILAPLFGTALVIAVAADPANDATGAANLSAQERSAATQPLVRSATDCIVRAVVSDPSFAAKPNAELGDLIVASMPACVTPVRAMIDGFDQYYGAGSGEAFFMGPYLDVLPKAITEAGRKTAAP